MYYSVMGFLKALDFKGNFWTGVKNNGNKKFIDQNDHKISHPECCLEPAAGKSQCLKVSLSLAPIFQ